MIPSGYFATSLVWCKLYPAWCCGIAQTGYVVRRPEQLEVFVEQVIFVRRQAYQGAPSGKSIRLRT